ncbi:predicted protein [Histoplasma mississippiense (nom. inval.)]|uniref:predicted protein n=1 Tax=Ajellomyces capsulatus (strain NAm1 / WU24) TaxID=2059318 RepID=UPI000157B613|nr:predicted protein [Histoplasma mississippiense (nom. inval.)]EDN03123.1 predicted protein [Histoplasma mississippiense (nom. inval.)]
MESKSGRPEGSVNCSRRWKTGVKREVGQAAKGWGNISGPFVEIVHGADGGCFPAVKDGWEHPLGGIHQEEEKKQK